MRSPYRLPLPSPAAHSNIDQLIWPALPGGTGQQTLALQAQLQISEWWTPEQLAQAQLVQLDALVRHAATYSPYYAKRFRRWKIDVSEPLTWERFRQIPVLTRDEVQRAGEALYATATPPGHGRVGIASTSGSSGKPVTVRKTELTLMLWRAVTLRDHLWNRRNFTDTSAHIRDLAGLRAQPPYGSTMDGWGSAVDDAFFTHKSATLDIRADIAAQAQWIKWQNPRYLLTYPSALRGVLDYWDEHGGAPTGIEQVRTISEMVRPGLRERTREVLGARLVDMYSSQEVGYLALQCPQHDHYHVQSETQLVEVLRDDGEPCAPGEQGRVVVTPLHHFGGPLLRYELGDGAEVGKPCPCGRGLPVLNRVLGRVRHMIHYPDGKTAWPTFGIVKLTKIAPIRQWRVVQTAIDTLELHLTPKRPLTKDEEQGLHEAIQAKLLHPMKLSFHYHPDGIAPGSNGKYEDFLCAFDPKA